MFKKILVCLDGSPASEAILPVVARAAEPGVEITLLTVANAPQGVVTERRPIYVGSVPAPGGVREIPAIRPVESRDQAIEHAIEVATEYLEGLAGILRNTGAKVSSHVAFGDSGEEIVNHAECFEADVIMMATHGRTALAEVVFGSVAAHVLRSGVRPVMLVRPKELS